jgi:metal-sulfur cluster biosynthetic enzyme
MQADDLDHRLDLGLRAPDLDHLAVDAQTAGDHRQVEHQRRVGEHELAEVDDHVGVGAQCADQCGPPVSLRIPILVAAAAQDRRLVIEVDDGRETYKKLRPPTRPERPTYLKCSSMTTVDEVTEALRDVIDPELGLDFVELGLIYDIEVEADGTVLVTYTLTSPGCPIGPQVSEQIEEFVGELDGVSDVRPTMTFSPPWTPERMSEDAKFALGF